MDSISSTYLRTVDQGARNWDAINEIVSESLLREHARQALARISRLAEPDSLLISPAAFESRMTTSAKLMAQFSEGIIGPMLKALWSKEIAHNGDNDTWKEQREWRKRQGGRYRRARQAYTNRQRAPANNKAAGRAHKQPDRWSLTKMLLLRAQRKLQRHTLQTTSRARFSRRKMPFFAKGQCRLMEECLLASTHEK